MPPEVTLTPKGERWRRTRHPWVYQDDIQKKDASFSGQVVLVKSPQGKELGRAFFNAKSKIGLRWLTDDPREAVDRDFWAKRLDRALHFRRRAVSDSNAMRLIFSEADGFPGFIVDQYDKVLVLQSLGLGIDQILPLLVELLVDRVKPSALLARNDASVRTLEGLPVEKRSLLGEAPKRITVKEGDALYIVDPWEGHKTGAYLDQRENRLWAKGFARGRVLDAFAYQGGFTIHAATAADQVLAIEDSEWALGLLRENLKANNLNNVEVERGNSFDRLRNLEREKGLFDLVILDPPAFAKNKRELPGACRGYREINLRAMRLLAPGGTLVTCSCSYQMSEDLFMAVLQEAAADAKRDVRLLSVRTQAADHPILLAHPESKYLKCVALEMI